MDFKTLSLISLDYAFDVHSDEESIRLDWNHDTSKFYYLKQKFLPNADLKFKNDDNDLIRFRSIWQIDLLTIKTIEVIPYGNYDIDEFRTCSNNYFYFHQIDYLTGSSIVRFNKSTHEVEKCFQTAEDFHGFEIVTDRYIVYRSEDREPDLSELIIIDMNNLEFTSIEMIRDDEQQFEFEFLKNENGEIESVMLTRWVPPDVKPSTLDRLVCCKWTDVVKTLTWKPYRIG